MPDKTCSYPSCNCPFDMGSDNKCLRGYPNGPAKELVKAKQKCAKGTCEHNAYARTMSVYRKKIRELIGKVNELRKEKPEFTVLAGRFDQGYIDDENPKGMNIKYINEFSSLPEAWKDAKRFYHDAGSQFVFIEYIGERIEVKV